MAPRRSNQQDIPEQDLVSCSWCPFKGRPQGIGAHKRFCPNRPGQPGNADPDHNVAAVMDAFITQQAQAGEDARQMALRRVPNNIDTQDAHRDNDLVPVPIVNNYDAGPMEVDENINDAPQPNGTDIPANTANTETGGNNNNPTHEINDIKVEQHPSTGNQEATYSFEVYYGGGDSDSSADSDGTSDSEPNKEPDQAPWRAFGTLLNFELAEVMQSAHLNHNEIETIIKIVHKVIQQPDQFTLKSYNDLDKAWRTARETMMDTPFKKTAVSAPYRNDTLEFDVWSRSITLWLRELLMDKDLIKEFNWNALRLYKFNGEDFERFIDEPWTADAWWDFQSTIPEGSFPLCIVLYADKTRLSSFGTEKGYPVLVRCANLPVEIRNSSGVGGGRLIGWLPIPDESPAENRRKEYVIFKRTIWHKAMDEIISSLKELRNLGMTLTCGDGERRTVFPHILIMSADYEEQTMMALLRGGQSLKPCPVCLVPKDQLSVIDIIPSAHERRTTQGAMMVYNRSQALNLTEREKLLKEYGMRDSENVFWSVPNVDVYSALSFDVLHAYDSGLFKAHILEEIRRHVQACAIDDVRKVETALDEMPRWPELNHFSNLNTGEMADGTKFEDLSKVIIFATMHLFTAEDNPTGYLLLRLTRSYLELRLTASLTVHTDSTIHQGELELIRFGKLLSEYKEATEDSPKSWDFPKAHTHTHMFEDIRRKGATRNYNTKLNEKANGPLKKYYQFRTNFKNVAPQILKVNEMDIVSVIIRDKITLLNEETQARRQQAVDDPDASSSTQVNTSDSDKVPKPRVRKVIGNDHIQLGSALSSTTLKAVETFALLNTDFLFFRTRLGQYFTGLLGKRVVLDEGHQITPYQFIRVFYRSLVDLNVERDILRVNKNFHNQERFDCAMIQVEIVNPTLTKAIFVRLLYLFTISLDMKTYYMALVLPMDAPCSEDNDDRDRDLRLVRVRPRPSTLIINAESILRGALLVKDGGSEEGEFVVNNFIDQDMWFRLKPEHTELVTNAII